MGLGLLDRYITGSNTGRSLDELNENPYPAYAEMRERGRVLRSFANRGWWIIGFDEVQAALTEARFSSEMRNNPFVVAALRATAEGPVPMLDDPSMLNLDPPDHSRLRKLAARGFVHRYIQSLEPRIKTIAESCLADVRPGDTVEIVETLAKPLPALVIAELLGVPDEDRAQFQQWSDDFVGITQAEDPERVQAAARAGTALTEYFTRIVEEKRRTPGQDLIGQLIAAEEEGDKLTSREVYSMCTLLLVAGHETTTRLISNGLHALLTHPDQLALLVEDAARIPSAVDEMLRYEPPVQWMPRTATETFEFHGQTIKKDHLVLVSMAAANRDPLANGDPDRFDITRDKPQHVAFGHGIHLCLGMTLARLEAKVVFQLLLERYPRIALAGDAVRWEQNTFVRGLEILHVKLTD